VSNTNLQNMKHCKQSKMAMC